MVKVSSLVKDLVANNYYKNCRLIVIDEKNKLVCSEMLNEILFKTYKLLKNYELISWRNDTIYICVVMAKRIVENVEFSA